MFDEYIAITWSDTLKNGLFTAGLFGSIIAFRMIWKNSEKYTFYKNEPLLAKSQALMFKADRATQQQYTVHIHRHNNLIWTICFIAAVFCLSSRYYDLRRGKLYKRNQDTTVEVSGKSLQAKQHSPQFPITDKVELIVKVDRPFDSRGLFNHLSGWGIVKKTANHPELEGQRIAYSVKHLNQDPLLRGEIFRATGIVEFIDPHHSLSDFDAFIRRNGIAFKFKQGYVREITQAASPLEHFYHHQHERLEKILHDGEPPNFSLGHIYAAMLLGKKSALTKEKKIAFAASGTMHLFAVSGLHVGVIAYTILSGLRLIRMPHYLSTLLCLILVYIYVQIVGASPSAMRAFLMTALFCGSQMVLRKPMSFSAFIVSAVCILLYKPMDLWNPGFQLSYSVVAALFLYGLPLSRALEKMCAPYPHLPNAHKTTQHRLIEQSINNTIRLFSMSLAATLISSPLCMIYFKIFSPGGILLNMLLIPLSFFVMVTGTLSIISGLLFLPGLPAFFNHGAWLVLSVMDFCVEHFVILPGVYKHIQWKTPILAGIVVMLLLGSFVYIQEQRKRKRLHWIYLLPIFIFFNTLLFGSKI